MTKPITAIVYDFDGTLSPGAMQEHTLLPELGFASPRDFWNEVKEECKRRDGDEILTYMQLMLLRAEGGLSRKALQAHGAKLPLFGGVPEWFSRLNDYAEGLGLSLKHFVISSGVRDDPPPRPRTHRAARGINVRKRKRRRSASAATPARRRTSE